MRKSLVYSLGLAAISGIGAMALVGYVTADQGPKFSFTEPEEIRATTLVVAAKPMKFGQRITPEDLKVIKWMSNEVPEGGFRKTSEVLPNEDAIRHVKAAIDPGEPLLASKLSRVGDMSALSSALLPGMKAVSIRVNDVVGVAGFIRPGDRVDVLATWTTREGKQMNTHVNVILQGVKVLAVGQTADQRVDKPTVVKTVTLEVATREAQALTLASGVGTLSLALRNMASEDVAATRTLSLADLAGGGAATALKKKVAVAKKIESSTVGVWNSTTREVHQVTHSDPRKPGTDGPVASSRRSSADGPVAMR